MTRTTETASKITIVLDGKDGKRYATYELYEGEAAFVDIANTLDHARAYANTEPIKPSEPRLKVARG